MESRHHIAYVLASIAAALIAALGVVIGSPALYGVVPGIIGGVIACVAAIRFIKNKEDLAGFVATMCGFVYYQEYQANPVTLPEFSDSLVQVPVQDQMVGLILANLTVAMLLIAFHLITSVCAGLLSVFVPNPARVARERCDLSVLIGFWVVFVLVALPNVLFGQVVVGPIHNILYQRLAWTDAAYSGYSVYGGQVGGSFANVGLWAVSLFVLWLYLLRSRYRLLMLVLSPLVLLWSAAVALQGSRTYVVSLGVGTIVYLFGRQNSGKKGFLHALWAVPVLLVAVQIMTYFRGTGLQSVNLSELSEHFLEIRGNEGASSEIDGIEYFRTELFARGIAPNPLVGFIRGIIGRPVEGVLMVVPRPLFPWKAEDESGLEFNLFYQRVRLGVDTDEAFLGASPGLIGRELIKYGYLGPITMLFWMGSILALADRLFSLPSSTDFHRIFSAVLVAFFIAQSRDFSPVWFIPYLPAGVVIVFVVLQSRRSP